MSTKSKDPHKKDKVMHYWESLLAWLKKYWRHLTGAFVIAAIFFALGFATANRTKPKEISINYTRLNQETFDTLNTALRLLKERKTEEAVEALKKLNQVSPRPVGLDYISAKAALLNQDYASAQEYANASVRRGERIGESLTIRAVARLHPTSTRMGVSDPVSIAQAAFEEAISADPLQSQPMFLCGEFLRKAGKKNQAAEYYLGSLLRTEPITDLILQNSLSLIGCIRSGEKSILELPEFQLDQGTPDVLIGHAYLALTEQRFDDAAKLLTRAREMVPAKQFEIIIRDQVFDEYREEPALRDILNVPNNSPSNS